MTAEITSILLPAARADIFVLDNGTAATARALADDWRFARVQMDVVEGGMAAAVERYGHSASPELVIVETNDIGEDFVAQLGALAEVCAEGTDAVIIGPTNDVHLYRRLVGMGVRDYLVRPVSAEDMASVVARTLVQKHGIADGRLIAVIGSKGGVGATVTAQVVAWQTAEEMKEKTVLMDVAGAATTIGVSFGLEPSTSLGEAVNLGMTGSDDDLRRILQPAGENLSLLVAGGDSLLGDGPDADGVETLTKRLMQKHPVVVVDLSGAAHAVQKRMISCASHVVVVTTPLLTALRNCRMLLNDIKLLRGGFAGVDLVISKRGTPQAEEVPAGDIAKVLELEPSATLPYAPKVVMASEVSGKPMGQNKGAAEFLQTLRGIAAAASGRKPAQKNEEKQGPFGFLKNLGKKDKA